MTSGLDVTGRLGKQDMFMTPRTTSIIVLPVGS
jgi:hypothetical protein